MDSLGVKLWPPSQSTRLMLVERMTKNLSTPSILSRKYGPLCKEEAEEVSKEIESMAFASASKHLENERGNDGSSAVQLYAKESSKLMLDVLKRNPRTVGDAEGEANTSEETVLDISGGQRAFIASEEAKKLLEPLKKPGNKFTTICFSNRSFGLDAAHVAGPILSKLKNQLVKVDLSDFIAGRPESEALEVMEIFSSALEGCQLRYLNLSNNALGEKGVRAFGELLKSQQSLEELYLMNGGISEEAAQAVCELIPSTKKLRALHFHNNMTGDEGALAISELVKRSSLLENFRCSSTRVGSEGGIALSEALGECTHLKKLDLRDNMFGTKAGVGLSMVLPRFSDLTEIYLSYLNLDDEGSIAIANALKESAPSLHVLEMDGNDMTVRAAHAIASCVAAKQFLTRLSLAENELKDDGAVVIAQALLEGGHGQLNEVDMSMNSIRRAGARSLARAVVSKPGFKVLNMNGNFISDEGVDEVKEIFKNCPNLLGPLDENDPEGEESDEGYDGGLADDENEIGSRLNALEITREE